VHHDDIQQLCARGQERLMATDYLSAIDALEEAERMALVDRDFDSLARLYMPLQEARRQKRQLAGEGVVRLDILARSEDDRIDAGAIAGKYPKAQLLLAGWASIEPAMQLRKIARERRLFTETFLAAVYPVDGARLVVMVPHPDVTLPNVDLSIPLDRLIAALPAHSIAMHENHLPIGEQKGSAATFAKTMAIWEQLHAPFLASADQEVDLMRRILAYKRTIEVDEACELAHQRLSDTAHALARRKLLSDKKL
jgi:hypothetical protein